MTATPQTFVIEKNALVPSDADPRDPRGHLLMWEPPQRSATYVIGCDPTMGIENWNRSFRTEEDARVDNAAIEIIRVGDIERGGKDQQVAEYAAPIAFSNLANVLNTLGRFYCGSNDEGLALVIIEIYPGPGLIVQADLKERYGYINLYQQPYLDTMVPTMRRNSPFGWCANRQTVRDLCLKGIHHVANRHVQINSIHLIEEMADCEPDPYTGIIAAKPPRHDDRVRAFFLALWAAHHWSTSLNIHETATTIVDEPKWQASAITYEQMLARWKDRVEQLLDD